MDVIRFVREKLGVYGVCAVVFFLLSLYSGLLGTLLGTAAWVFFGSLAIVCLCMAFRNVYRYGLWLIGIYVFGGIGGYLLTYHDLTRFAGGIICEIIGVFVIISLTGSIVRLRKETRSKSSLGLWFLAVLIFFVFTNLSLSDMSYWLMNESKLYLYVFSEIVIIFSGVYILWVLETKIHVSMICPICNGELRVEKRKCPSCNKIETFFWCRKSEHHIIKCPYCNRLIVYGRKCVHCKKMVKKIKCRSCNNEYTLNKWLKE